MQPRVQTANFEIDKLTFTWKTRGHNLFLISIGIFIFVLGMNCILIPNKLLGAGVSGIAIIIHYLFPSFDVGLIYFLLNIPLLLLGWFNISRRFMFYTIFGMVVFSMTAALIKPPPILIDDNLLAAIFSGVVCGTGAGITLRSIGSAGGIDILAIYGNQKFGFRPGVISFYFNAVILIAGTYFFGLKLALYAIIYVYTSSKILDAVITGFNQRMSTLIISDKSKQIASEIFKQVNRGATLLQGKGAYSGKQKDVMLTITTLTELPKLKKVIFDIDAEAFVVINSTLEVLGKRHGTRKIY